MKKLLLIALLLSGYVGMFAQTGIGTDNPDSDAILDVFSNTKGFLPPRVALINTISASPLSAHVAGMVVYNTATAGSIPNNVTPGIYFSDGTSWKQFTTSVQKASSYFGTVNYGDIGGGHGFKSCTGFIVSAQKNSVNPVIDELIVTHNLNLTGNQFITASIVANTGDANSQQDQLPFIFYSITANSFKIFIEETVSWGQNMTLLIQLSTY